MVITLDLGLKKNLSRSLIRTFGDTTHRKFYNRRTVSLNLIRIPTPNWVQIFARLFYFWLDPGSWFLWIRYTLHSSKTFVRGRPFWFHNCAIFIKLDKSPFLLKVQQRVIKILTEQQTYTLLFKYLIESCTKINVQCATVSTPFDMAQCTFCYSFLLLLIVNSLLFLSLRGFSNILCCASF